MEIEDIKDTQNSAIAPLKICKKIIVLKVDTTMAAILLPINIVDKDRSNLLMILRSNLAVLLPSSALIWILKRLQQDKAVSLAEKKACNNTHIAIINHDIGSGISIKQPLPFSNQVIMNISYTNNNINVCPRIYMHKEKEKVCKHTLTLIIWI